MISFLVRPSRKIIAGVQISRAFSAESTAELFQRSVAAIQGDTPAEKEVTNEIKLNLYALFKQADVGACTGDKPSMFDPVARAKHAAWSSLGTMSKDEAMDKYVAVVHDLFGGKLPTASQQPQATDVSQAGTERTVKAATFNVSNLFFPRKQTDVLSKLELSTTATSVDADTGIQHILLNRPKRGNAFNLQMWAELKLIFDSIENDGTSKVAILSGSNGHFSTGMDLSVFADMNKLGLTEPCEARRREGLSKFIQYLQDIISAPETSTIPVIAAVSGNCIGGAVDLVTACDLRYCTKDAVFCVKEIDLAIVADIGTLQRLPKLIGHQRAAELSYTGRNVTGTEAAELGLVLECFDTEEQMMAHVRKVALQIAEKSPVTTRGVKRALLFSRDHSVPESLHQVKMWNTAMLHSEDLMEAMRAILSKDSPTFRKGH